MKASSSSNISSTAVLLFSVVFEGRLYGTAYISVTGGVKLGACEGKLDGITDGVPVGDTVGKREGSVLGSCEIVGELDGTALGMSLGTTLATTLGCIEGIKLGVIDGYRLGPKVALVSSDKDVTSAKAASELCTTDVNSSGLSAMEEVTVV